MPLGQVQGNGKVSFCTGKVVVGDSTVNVLCCVDTWEKWLLPLFLAFGRFWVFLLSQWPLQFLGSSLA